MYRTYDELPRIKLPSGIEPLISDSTFRDGYQMPGISMTSKHKLDIYKYLHDIGIEKTECFLYSDHDKKAARDMLDLGYEKPVVTAWSRANEKDIDLVLAMDGIKETGILMSVSDSHIFDKLSLNNREEAEEKYLKALDYAVDHGLKVRCHLEDTTRSDLDGFVLPFTKKILEHQKDAIIRVCDTLGLGIPFPESELPFSMPKIIAKMKEIGVQHIETHCHDDYGFAVPNSLAGYWYGADWSNVTFLGIGERAGNAELEKLLVFLVTRVEGFQKYDVSKLVEFSEYMEKEMKVHVPRNKGVVGKNIFAHESGIHTAGVIKNPFTYEPFTPELIGGKRSIMIGQSSGADVVRLKIEGVLHDLMNVEVKVDKRDPRVNAIQDEIKKLYDKGRRSKISDDEVKKYVEKYFMFEPVVDEVKIEEDRKG